MWENTQPKAAEGSVQQEFHCWLFEPNETLVIICCAFVTLICKYSEKRWRFFFSVGFFDCFIGLKYLIRNFLLCSEVELFSCLWQVECIDIAQGL